MTRNDDYRDDSNFERVKRGQKNPKKGKHNRSNEKQTIREHYSEHRKNYDETDDDFMDKWEDR